MFTIMGILLGCIFICFLIVRYIDYKYSVHENKKFEKNLKKFKTRTGALSNDRVNERTTIPKRNGKRNT
jgi:uncharacterized membrane-anchored protein YhcB (DUF1043 family)|tara:strand:+ start:207 stop:413 length:207 start_codon:yes stop_codon:yes gene_type:complete